jgi:hypothetical protein
MIPIACDRGFLTNETVVIAGVSPSSNSVPHTSRTRGRDFRKFDITRNGGCSEAIGSAIERYHNGFARPEHRARQNAC